MIARITKVYTRKYTDNGKVCTYVEWVDSLGQTGRTEGPAKNAHMAALIAHGAREGVEHTEETW